ncbi:MAG: lipid-binding SYLF domain-containing protein [Planctomycetota bacterium]|jgi:lipid-binding SYLF domain-containing protein
MKTSITVLLAICVVVAISGCSKAVGDDASEKRAYAQQMKTDTLAELYEKKPEAKEKIANAAGYGVFSNINLHLFLLSSGNGYGIIHDQSNGEETYMKMRGFGVGFGAGAKDFRAVIIFKSQDALDTFTTKGWEWSGEADAAAKSKEKGGEISGEAEVTGSMEIYTLNEAGIALQATISGTKYWRDKELSPRPEDDKE